MLTKEAIQELAKAETIRAADAALGTAAEGTAALPNDFSIHDLEKFMPSRRRLRGTMSTSSAEDFAAYAKANKELGAAVFVDADRMAATAVLNLGDGEFPGHADNIATLALRKTAPFIALQAKAGPPLKQTDLAEFLEDWAPHITCADSSTGETIENKHAVQAVRKITIESLKRVESSEQQLGAERSAFESVQARSAERIPTLITFRCEPYQGLALRPFKLRLSILTSDSKPVLVLRHIAMERHVEEMAAELANLVEVAIGEDMPVHIGTYSAKA